MSTTGTHRLLCNFGAAWFKREGFGVVAQELVVGNVREQTDVIAFRSTCSAVMESKVSRADFLRDKLKPHRIAGGLGNYRFFICPEGLIEPSELPTGWGLLYQRGSRTVAIVRPPGNMWPKSTVNDLYSAWRPFWHPSDAEAERSVLYSIARRKSPV